VLLAMSDTTRVASLDTSGVYLVSAPPP